MRCKVGDLAFYVGARLPDQVGKIVQCVAFAGNCPLTGAPGWKIEPELPSVGSYNGAYALDASLRPIRDNPGEDEMLRIAGKPGEIRRLTDQQWAAIEARWGEECA